MIKKPALAGFYETFSHYFLGALLVLVAGLALPLIPVRDGLPPATTPLLPFLVPVPARGGSPVCCVSIFPLEGF